MRESHHLSLNPIDRSGPLLKVLGSRDFRHARLANPEAITVVKP